MVRPKAPDAPGALRPTLAAAGLTAVAMLAFAANSLLCRLALRQDHIDPASFGAIRLAAGALVLACLMRGRSPASGRGDWRAPFASAALLFAYVALFSFAYVSLAAGTGALILFGTVQLTMLGAGLLAGERFTPLGWSGMLLARAGGAGRVVGGAPAAWAGGGRSEPRPPPASCVLRRWASCWRWSSRRARMRTRAGWGWPSRPAR
jgi:hypothetical protein